MTNTTTKTYREVPETKKVPPPPEFHGTMDARNDCCGLSEYVGLNYGGFTAEKALNQMLRYTDFSHIIMTQVHHTGYTENLDELIALVNKTGVGSIVKAEANENPNSGNIITAAIFTPHYAGMRNYRREVLGK